MDYEAVIGCGTRKMFVALTIVLGVISAPAAGRDDVAKQSKRTEAKTKTLRQEIQKEIKKLGKHEWAGDYYEGDGLGENVTLTMAPKAGYVFEWHGCLGLYDLNYGAVTSTNGRLRLSFTFTNRQEGFEGIADEFIPVRWGERMYLVPSDKVVGFCNDVNSGREPRKRSFGQYLLRCGDETKRASGNPVVPPAFQAYLLKQPIQASIMRIGKTSTRPSRADFKFKDTAVTLDAGKRHGLLPGMELYVTDPGRLVETVTVVSVAEEASEGMITQMDEYDPAPKVGWKLSTSPPWRAEFTR